MKLMVNVLGQLTISADGRQLGKVPKKGRALLAYLAMAGAPVTRERLADLLWPYQGSEQARHSLRNCLLELRKALGPARAQLHTDFYTCSVEAETDLQRVRQLAEAGQLDRLREASWLVSGELLEDLVIDSEPWGEWLDHERDLAVGTLGPVLTKYSAAASAAGRHDEAVAAAQQLVKLNNLNEESHRCLMRVFAAAGQRGAALHQFKKLGQLLKAELGVTPDRASCALADEIAGKVEADLPEPPALAPAAPPPAPLRVIPAEVSDDDDDPITLKLDKLVAEIRSWKSGIARLTRPLIDECETSMVTAAADRRRLTAEIQRLTELVAALHHPSRISESVAA